MINLQNFQIALKIMIDGHTSRPFLATTLPLPASRNQNRSKVLQVSRERYAKKVKPEIGSEQSAVGIKEEDDKTKVLNEEPEKS